MNAEIQQDYNIMNSNLSYNEFCTLFTDYSYSCALMYYIQGFRIYAAMSKVIHCNHK